MKDLKERIVDISSHLQSLMTPALYQEVQEAVDKKDKNLLMKVCRKAKIPESYLGTIASVLLSVSPQQKWPAMF